MSVSEREKEIERERARGFRGARVGESREGDVGQGGAQGGWACSFIARVVGQTPWGCIGS